jgi:hypothetical protein
MMSVYEYIKEYGYRCGACIIPRGTASKGYFKELMLFTLNKARTLDMDKDVIIKAGKRWRRAWENVADTNHARPEVYPPSCFALYPSP